jgi:hypothetical protein
MSSDRETKLRRSIVEIFDILDAIGKEMINCSNQITLLQTKRRFNDITENKLKELLSPLRRKQNFYNFMSSFLRSLNDSLASITGLNQNIHPKVEKTLDDLDSIISRCKFLLTQGTMKKKDVEELSNRKRVVIRRLSFSPTNELNTCQLIIINLIDKFEYKGKEYDEVVQLLKICRKEIHVDSLSKFSSSEQLFQALRNLKLELEFFKDIEQDSTLMQYFDKHELSLYHAIKLFSVSSTTTAAQFQWSAIHRLACLLEQHL